MGKLDEIHRRSLERPEEFWAEVAGDVVWNRRWDRVLDDRPTGGDGVMTLLALDDAFTDVELFLLPEGLSSRPYRLALSYEEYLRCALTVLGYSHWQLPFCVGLPERMHDWAHGRFVRKLEADLARVLPEVDLTEFLALSGRVR